MREVHEDLARAPVAGAPRLVQPVVDVDPPHVVHVLGDAVELFERDGLEGRFDLYVLSEDDDVHVLPIECIECRARLPTELAAASAVGWAVGVGGVYAAGCDRAPGRGVRAIVAASTSE